MVTHINITDQSEAVSIDVERICTHPNAYVEKACCTTPDSDTGMISCGCGGQDAVICPDCNDDLDDATIERVLGGGEEVDCE